VTRLDPATAAYMAGLVWAEALRCPSRLRRARTRRTRPGPRRSDRAAERLVLLAIVAGVWVLPLAWILTDWWQRFDYSLPGGVTGAGSLVFAAGLVVRYRAHRALGSAWSPTVETTGDQVLVRCGIYSRIRHPIYASLVLWAVAQPLLLHNLLAGWGGPVAVATLWLVRVPREERMMLGRFGEEYRQYMARTGRLVPRIKRGVRSS
jgi:protein-S-isoprenylcysteine O-methyltransferase Ste14